MRSSCKCARLSPVKSPVAERNVQLLRYCVGKDPFLLVPARGSLNRCSQSITWSSRYHLLTLRPLRLFQDDYPQPAQRLVYLFFLQQAEGCPHISRACTVRKKHISRKREDTALEGLSSDDTLRVSVLTKKEPEPGNAICVTISHNRILLERSACQKNIPASGVFHSAMSWRCRRMAASNTSRLVR